MHPNHSTRTKLLCVILGCAFTTVAHAQQIIYVNAAAAPGGDGTSWATAYTSPQQALDITGSSQQTIEVWIAGGSYTPTRRSEPADPRSASFSLPASADYPTFRLIGGFTGSESSIADRTVPPAATVFSGDLAGNDGAPSAGFMNHGDNAYHVLRVTPPTGSAVFLYLIDITVTGGNANGPPTHGHDRGAGLWVSGGFIEMIGCVIERCYGEVGAAVRVEPPTHPNNATAAFHHSTIRANAGPAGAFAIDAGGGRPGLSLLNSAVHSNSGGIRAECSACELGGGEAQIVVLGSTIAHSASAAGEPQVVMQYGVSLFTADSIIWSPTQEPVLRIRSGARYTLLNSSIKGGLEAIDFPDGYIAPAPAENVLQFDPLFADPDGTDNIAGTTDDDFSLQAISPAIDQAESYVSFQSHSYPRDARGGRRFADADSDGHYAVDWGAYEYAGTGPKPIVYVNANLAGGADNGTSWANAYRGPAALESALNSVNGGEYADVWVAQGDYYCNLPLDPLNPGVRPGRGFRLAHSARLFGGFVGDELTLSQRPSGGRSRVSHASNMPGANAPAIFELFEHVSGTLYWGELVLDGLAYIDEDFASGAGRVISASAFRSAFRNQTFQNTVIGNQSLFFAGSPSNTGGGLNAFAEASGISASNVTVTGSGGLLYLHVPATVRDVNVEQCVINFGGAFIYSGGSIHSCRVSDLSCIPMSAVATFVAGSIRDSVFQRISNTSGYPVLQADLIERCELTLSSGAGTQIAAARAEQFVLRHDPAAPPESRGPLDFQIEQCANCTLLGMGNGVGSTAFPYVNSVLQTHDGGTPPFLGTDLVNCVINLPPAPGSTGALVNCRVVSDPLLDPVTARPLAGSAAIDAGCNALAPRDLMDLDLDGDSDEVIPIDLTGTIRMADDPQSVAALCPVAATPNIIGLGPIDAGALEYAPQCPQCPGDRVWLDPAGGLFHDASNWIFGVPDATHPTVCSLPYQYTILLAADAASRRLRVDRGDVTLDLAGRRYDLFEIGTASLVVDAPSAGRGSMVVPTASLSLTGGGTLQGSYARIGDQSGNAGAITVSGAGTRLSFGQQGMCLGCAGSGLLAVLDGATCVARTLSVGELPGAFGRIGVYGAGSRLVVPFFLTLDRGALDVGPGSRVETGFGLFALQGAHVTGSGQIVGDVVNFGLMEPTSTLPAAGMIEVLGDFEQVGVNPKIGPQSGTLRLSAAGTGNTITSDSLAVTGTARLAGALLVEPVGGFNPSPSAPPANLLSAGTTIGRFDLAVFPGLTGNKFMRLAYPSPFERGGAVSVSVDTLAENIDLDPATSASVSGRPNDLVLADFDTDGDADLALCLPDAANPDSQPGQVVILRNAGNTGPGGSWAGFTGGQVTVNVGVNPRGIAAGRLNADTAPDLIVANFSSNTVTVLTNANNGVAAMNVTQTIPVGAGPVAVVTGVLRDASGGAIDAAVANHGSDSVSILHNTSGALAVTSTLASGDGPSDITIARLDAGAGQSTLDIAVTNENDDTATVYYRPPGGGYPLSPSRTLPTSIRPVSIEPGGLDNPKDLNDLAVSNNGSGSVSILLNNNLADGLAGFQPKADLPTGATPGSLTLGDLDSDGDPDLSVVSMVGGQQVVSVFRNDVQEVSPGVFQAAFAPFGDQYAGLDPRLVTSGDVNNDGRDDLIAVNDLTLMARPRSSAGEESPPRQGERGVVAQPNVSISLSAAPFVPPPCVGDFTNDRAVNTADLVFFLGAFGKPATPPGSGADINADATVNTADLVIFLGVFGQVCP